MFFDLKNKILALFYWSEVKKTLKMASRIIHFYDFDLKSNIFDISLPDDMIMQNFRDSTIRTIICKLFSLKWSIIRKDWISLSLSFVTAKKLIFSLFWDKSRYGGVLLGIHIRNAKVFFYIFCSICLLKCATKLLHVFLFLKFVILFWIFNLKN